MDERKLLVIERQLSQMSAMDWQTMDEAADKEAGFVEPGSARSRVSVESLDFSRFSDAHIGVEPLTDGAYGRDEAIDEEAVREDRDSKEEAKDYDDVEGLDVRDESPPDPSLQAGAKATEAKGKLSKEAELCQRLVLFSDWLQGLTKVISTIGAIRKTLSARHPESFVARKEQDLADQHDRLQGASRDLSRAREEGWFAEEGQSEHQQMLEVALMVIHQVRESGSLGPDIVAAVSADVSAHLKTIRRDLKSLGHKGTAHKLRYRQGKAKQILPPVGGHRQGLGAMSQGLAKQQRQDACSMDAKEERHHTQLQQQLQHQQPQQQQRQQRKGQGWAAAPERETGSMVVVRKHDGLAVRLRPEQDLGRGAGRSGSKAHGVGKALGKASASHRNLGVSRHCQHVPSATDLEALSFDLKASSRRPPLQPAPVGNVASLQGDASAAQELKDVISKLGDEAARFADWYRKAEGREPTASMVFKVVTGIEAQAQANQTK